MPALEPSPVLAPVETEPGLAQKLTALRHRWLLVKLVTGAAIATILTLQIGALAMLIDWWVELPWFVRCLSLLMQLALLGVVLARYVLMPLWHQPDDDDLALLVERQRPEFRSRLISTIQLTRPAAQSPDISPFLVEATRAETARMAVTVDFVSLISLDRMKKLAGSALALTVAAVFTFGYGAGTTFDLVKRLFLSTTPVPRKTRVLVLEGNRLIGIGDHVKLEAVAAGVIPDRGQVEIRAPGRRVQQFPMVADPADRTHFVRTLQNVQESFVYTVQLNDGRSPLWHIRAVPRPTVSSMVCLQEFPPYTGLAPVRRPLGDLSLLAGSRLILQVTATKSLRSGAVKLIGSNAPPPLMLNVAATNKAVLKGDFSIPASGLSGFSISMIDEEAMESNEAAVYRIEILPDKVPLVRIVSPLRKEELVTRDAHLDVGIEVSDDFALSKVMLRFKTDTMQEGATQMIDLELGHESVHRLTRRFDWDLSHFQPRLTEGVIVEFWVEAVDNNMTTGPGTGASEHQIARVVSETEKRADLLNRAADIFSSLNDAAEDQEKLNRKLGDAILEKTGAR